MASLNKVMIIGNLTRDPELRYTPKGMAVTDISLAVNRTYSTAEGERREEVTFLDVTYWGKQAEVLAQYMKKGRPLYVEGRLRLDSWDDKETGKKQSRLKITGEEFQFLGSREGGGGGEGNYEGGNQRSSGGSGGNYGGGGGGNTGGGGGGYSQNRPAQSQRPPQQSSGGGGGGDYEDAPPPRSTGGGNSGGGQQQRPDAFPPGLDDDEIPF
ncbi:MAG: single-stranded DNA-binding protein [Verrucomicrobiota bacterium]